MSEPLNLTLPERKPTGSAGAKALLVLLCVVLAVGLANLALVYKNRGGAPVKVSPALLPAESQKELALKLEKQALHQQSAEAWKEYLERASLDDKERAAVWYRIGKLYEDAGDYAQALDGYYRSERFADHPDFRSDIARHTEQCLENLGKFAALRYELAERTSLSEQGAAEGDAVVAEIGPQKITRSELDRRIEAEVGRQLEQVAAFLPEDERKGQKERMLKQLTSGEGRIRMLQQIIAEEILYRKARESKLADKQEVRELLKDMERKILAQRVLDEEVGAKVNITPGDVETYYAAHKTDYVRPERVRLSLIAVKSEEEAAEVMRRIEAGEDFAAVAKEVSLDKATKEAGGAIEAWIEKGKPIPGLGASEEAGAAIFSTEAGSMVKAPIQTERGYHVLLVREREPEYQRPFEEARQEVYRALRAQKEGEVQEKLLADLREAYDVVIHSAEFGKEEPEGELDKGDAAK